MKLLRNLLTVTAIALLMVSSADAASVIINALDLRDTGVFGHNANLTSSTTPGTGAADPLDWTIGYTNLDLDGDGTANDTVNFTVRATGGTNQRAFNQGVDTGFGSLGDFAAMQTGVTFSVLNVSGTTTDLGDTIVFDGFTGGAVGFGGNGDLINSVDINGTTVSLNSPDTGSFQFLVRFEDFAPTPTIVYDNSVRDGIGTIVARNHDLQFSTVAATIPEPSSLALLGLAGLGFVTRRRR